MNISLGELDVDVVESAPDNEDRCPRGPFSDPAVAIHDLAAWVQRRYVDPPAALAGEAALAPVFLANAAGFLAGWAAGEVRLAAYCNALKLTLKAYLLAAAFPMSGSPNTSPGSPRSLPAGDAPRLARDDARIDGFIGAVQVSFQTHALMALAVDRPDLAAGLAIAMRGVHREV